MNGPALVIAAALLVAAGAALAIEARSRQLREFVHQEVVDDRATTRMFPTAGRKPTAIRSDHRPR